MSSINSQSKRSFYSDNNAFYRRFTRVFPSAGSDRYFSFMDRVRYYNVLLDAWQKKFGKDRQSAIAFIKEKCMNKEG